MSKSKEILSIIPNTSKEITQWRKDNKLKGNAIKVWACNGKNTFAQPEEGELICINPETLNEGRATQLMGRPIWKYRSSGSTRTIGCESRRYCTNEKDSWKIYYKELTEQKDDLAKKMANLEQQLMSTANVIITIKSEELGRL